ncbi:putative late blight resistance protein homolog R1A-4 [Salvia hispanica]|uniref:putative late blight resistance protein homolog R1A-4 n=1 Tax=Salvia hispanica TaxID=49212 RepID=UPI00200965E5|nr:putative late blight resistance protein homolog R1A-4 [Salvia hispanica]
MLSLVITLNDILHCSRYDLDNETQRIVQVLIKELQPWRKFLERLDKTSPSQNALDGRIKEAVWKFEDSLESLLTQQIPSQLQTLPEIVPIDLQSLQDEAHSLIETLKDMKKTYIYEVENMPQDEPITSSIGFHGTNSKMIGLSDQFQLLKTDLMKLKHNRISLHTLVGTAGVGKTTLAMQIYQHPQIHSYYEFRAWVTVGRIPQPTSLISEGIIAQLCGIGITQGDEEIHNCSLKERLRDKNCLIVLDEVWDRDALFSLKFFYEDIRHECIQVLVSSRRRKLSNDYGHTEGYEVRFLNEEESMELLCDKVFGDEICPPRLHKAVVKIAKHCEGLPLLIIIVAAIISTSEQ